MCHLNPIMQTYFSLSLLLTLKGAVVLQMDK